MQTIPLAQRQRILVAYDRGNATRQEIADRFKVSLGMVKKLLQQRQDTGDIAPLHHRSGRKPLILEKHRQKMQALLAKKPGSTLKQLRDAAKLNCSLAAIHHVLKDMGLTSRRKRSKPTAKAARSVPKRPARGRSASKPSARKGQAKR